jgi:NAD(P)-dependent dehydrogenase (short-subunit alcohol dehydrogenase family)
VHTALVTGAASGIGRALAAALVQQGSHVVLADLDGAAAGQAASELGPRAVPAQVDVRDREAVRELVERSHRDHDGLDLLINNAGTGVGGPISTLTAEHWRAQLEVNLYGVLHGIEAAYPLMLARGQGQICSTSSLSGLVPAPTLGPYTTSKFAVVGLSLALRAEAAAAGVRVSVLCPGFTETPLLDGGRTTDAPPTAVTSIRPLIRATRLRPVPPQLVARDCLAGLRRDTAVIVTPLTARVAWRLNRLAPALAGRVASLTARAALTRLQSESSLLQTVPSPTPSRGEA